MAGDAGCRTAPALQTPSAPAGATRGAYGPSGEPSEGGEVCQRPRPRIVERRLPPCDGGAGRKGAGRPEVDGAQRGALGAQHPVNIDRALRAQYPALCAVYPALDLCVARMPRTGRRRGTRAPQAPASAGSPQTTRTGGGLPRGGKGTSTGHRRQQAAEHRRAHCIGDGHEGAQAVDVSHHRVRWLYG